MSRRPRPDYNHTYHHIVVRGVDGLPIFSSDKYKQTYLDLIKDVRTTHDISFYAFGFLSNHMHQLIRRNNQKIGRFYRRVNGRFAQWYNNIHDRTGSLFNGRYYSSLVEKDSYLFSLIQYIHNQGVEAGLYDTPTEDPWNTAGLYAGKDKRFDWVDHQQVRSELLDQIREEDLDFSGKSRSVETWFKKGLPTERVRDQVFLASENYIEKYIQIRKGEVRKSEREASPVSWDTLLELAQEESGLDHETLTEPTKERKRSHWRSGLAYAGRCYAHMSVSELADMLAVTPSGISRMVKRVKRDKLGMKNWWDRQIQQ